MPIKTLTDRTCESMKPGKTRIDVRDAKSAGLEFRVSPSGVKSWAIRYRRKSDGKQQRFTLGNYPVIGLHEARALAAHVQAQVLAGNDPAGERRAQKAVDTFDGLAERYITRYAKKRKRTWAEDQRILDRELSPIIGSMKINEIRRRDIINLLDDIADRGSPVMANRTLSLVSKVFRWAESEDLIDAAPVHGIQKRAVEKPRDRALDDAEIVVLWNGLRDWPITEQLKDAIRLCLLLGQRVGEILPATRDEFDLDARLWTLPPERVKNKRKHTVPLADMAFGIVSRNLKQSDGPCLFPSTRRDQCLKPLAPNRAIARNHAQFGLEKFTSHDLRRSMITGLARLGIDRLVIAKCVNHASADLSSVTGSTYDQHTYLPEKPSSLRGLGKARPEPDFWRRC